MIDQAKSNFPWKVLVVDDFGLKVLSTLTKLFDLAEEKISVIEKLALKRKPLRDMDAMYFVAPTEQSVDKIIEDFESNAKRLYNGCHLFFTSTLPEDLFQKISQSPVSKFIKTFKEANLEFLVVESQVYVVDVLLDINAPKSFANLIAPSMAKYRKPELARIGRQVATLCATIGEYPIVRYSAVSIATSDGPLAKLTSTAIQDQLDNIYRLDSEAVANDRARAILLVVDRSVDLVAPFLHELTYQAMVNDLLDVNAGKYTYQVTDGTGKTVAKTMTLEEEDEKWANLRHKHIADCAKIISTDFKDFVSQNQSLREVSKSDPKAKSLKDVGALIRAAPQYTAELSQYSLHMNLTQSVIDAYRTKKCEELAQTEQNLATRETAQGDPFKGMGSEEIITLLSPPHRTGYDKVRVLAIYILNKGGISNQEKASLFANLGLTQDEKDALEGLLSLGIRQESLQLPQKADKKKVKKEETYDDSRYVPKLKKILESLIEGDLSADEYPYLKETPLDDDEDSRKRGVSMRTAKSNWTKGQKKEETSTKGPRVLVFIAGGATFSEMRTVYEITSREILLGSTTIYKPNEFVDMLKTLPSKS